MDPVTVTTGVVGTVASIAEGMQALRTANFTTSMPGPRLQVDERLILLKAELTCTRSHALWFAEVGQLDLYVRLVKPPPLNGTASLTPYRLEVSRPVLDQREHDSVEARLQAWTDDELAPLDQAIRIFNSAISRHLLSTQTIDTSFSRLVRSVAGEASVVPMVSGQTSYDLWPFAAVQEDQSRKWHISKPIQQAKRARGTYLSVGLWIGAENEEGRGCQSTQ